MLKSLQENDDVTVRWHASHLLNRIYPGFEDPLQNELSKILESATEDDLDFMATNLVGYEGNADLFPLYRNILASVQCNEEIAKKLSGLIHETGVMSGEYGVVESYRGKIELLTPWRDDPNENVANFAIREIKSLERQVAVETRRAQESIALRKLEYGEPLDNPTPDDGSSDIRDKDDGAAQD